SKSCSELVTHSYINSFFNDMEVAVSTARAGNVIGGGDFANDRIVPDCIRAAIEKRNIIVFIDLFQKGYLIASVRGRFRLYLKDFTAQAELY
ncbi:MAG: hypothetical protein ACI3ZD_01065, partial [Prevotella sp.]